MLRPGAVNRVAAQLVRPRRRQSPELGANGARGDRPAVQALLYDAEGGDRPITLGELSPEELDARRLLWIDVVDPQELAATMAWLGLGPDAVERVVERPREPGLRVESSYIHLVVLTAGATSLGFEPHALDILAGDNWVLTAHDPGVDLLERFDGQVSGDTQLGSLDAPGLVSVFMHEHLASYVREIEPFELSLDRLDIAVMTGRGDDPAVFRELVTLRRRLAQLRRLLARHREVYGRLGRPDFQMVSEVESPEEFASLAEGVEQTLAALDGTREMIVSSFEVYTTWTAHATNRFMKVLTVASATLLPPTLVTSIMGMNSLPHALVVPTAFAATMALIATLLVTVLGTARWRGWI
jgi:Mg2+ and Co2+ transporter CorA